MRVSQILGVQYLDKRSGTDEVPMSLQKINPMRADEQPMRANRLKEPGCQNLIFMLFQGFVSSELV